MGDDCYGRADAELGSDNTSVEGSALVEFLVLDASIALQVAASDTFRTLAAFELVAPPLLWSEAVSALHESLFRREITRELAVAVRESLIKAPIDKRSPPDLHAEAWSVAEMLGWAKTYDAEYVALARLLGCRLLTVDARLRRGADWVANVIGPAEL